VLRLNTKHTTTTIADKQLLRIGSNNPAIGYLPTATRYENNAAERTPDTPTLNSHWTTVYALLLNTSYITVSYEFLELHELHKSFDINAISSLFLINNSFTLIYKTQ
jgi:hypothetical protein